MILTYLLLTGILIGLLFYIYSRFQRKPVTQITSDIPSHSMVGRKSDKITTGKVPKPMPRRLVSTGEEE